VAKSRGESCRDRTIIEVRRRGQREQGQLGFSGVVARRKLGVAQDEFSIFRGHAIDLFDCSAVRARGQQSGVQATPYRWMTLTYGKRFSDHTVQMA
jgi:hypothetical protein